MKKWKIVLCVGLAFALLTGCREASYHHAVEELEEGNYQEAASDFETSIKLEVSLADSYQGLGICRYELEDYEGAMEALEESVEAGEEESFQMEQMMGNCALALEDYESVISYFEKAIALGEAGQEAAIQTMRFDIISCYEKLEDYDSAKELLTDYLADYPEDEDAAKEAAFLETQWP